MEYVFGEINKPINKKNMTSKAALCKALLDGQVLNIMNGFKLFGVTNLPREIGRSVERAFDVQVSRTPMEGKSRYGQPCNWVNYHLNQTKYNSEGVKKMREYVQKELATFNPKTTKEMKAIKMF